MGGQGKAVKRQWEVSERWCRTDAGGVDEVSDPKARLRLEHHLDEGFKPDLIRAILLEDSPYSIYRAPQRWKLWTSSMKLCQSSLRLYRESNTEPGGGQRPPSCIEKTAPFSRGKKENKDPNPELSNGHLIALDSDAALNVADQERWHFSVSANECGKAGPFSVERLKMDLPFVQCSVCTNKYTARCSVDRQCRLQGWARHVSLQLQ